MKVFQNSNSIWTLKLGQSKKWFFFPKLKNEFGLCTIAMLFSENSRKIKKTAEYQTQERHRSTKTGKLRRIGTSDVQHCTCSTYRNSNHYLKCTKCQYLWWSHNSRIVISRNFSESDQCIRNYSQNGLWIG